MDIGQHDSEATQSHQHGSEVIQSQKKKLITWKETLFLGILLLVGAFIIFELLPAFFILAIALGAFGLIMLVKAVYDSVTEAKGAAHLTLNLKNSDERAQVISDRSHAAPTSTSHSTHVPTTAIIISSTATPTLSDEKLSTEKVSENPQFSYQSFKKELLEIMKLEKIPTLESFKTLITEYKESAVYLETILKFENTILEIKLKQFLLTTLPNLIATEINNPAGSIHKDMGSIISILIEHLEKKSTGDSYKKVVKERGEKLFSLYFDAVCEQKEENPTILSNLQTLISSLTLAIDASLFLEKALTSKKPGLIEVLIDNINGDSDFYWKKLSFITKTLEKSIAELKDGDEWKNLIKEQGKALFSSYFQRACECKEELEEEKLSNLEELLGVYQLGINATVFFTDSLASANTNNRAKLINILLKDICNYTKFYSKSMKSVSSVILQLRNKPEDISKEDEPLDIITSYHKRIRSELGLEEESDEENDEDSDAEISEDEGTEPVTTPTP